MQSFFKSRNRGFGLIEILITTVVIAVGLLAIASLQGGLTGTSRVNKTRSEAKAICDTKLEQLRDTLIQADFTALATGNDTVTGSNEVITRNWGVTDLTAPVRKQISVTCTWPGTGNASDRQVLVQSIISFEDLGAASQVALAAAGGIDVNDPSTNADSSDEIHDDTDRAIPGTAVAEANGLFRTGIDGLEDGQYLKEDGVNVTGDPTGSVVYLCSDLIPFENDLFTRRVHYQPIAGTFKEAIELFEDNHDGLTCTRRIRYNGGVILVIQGVVFSRATTGAGGNATLLELRDASDTELFTFNASESGSFCLFKPETGATSAPYVCYVGGNCVNGPVGTIKTTDGINFSAVTSTYNENTIATQCPDPFDNTTTLAQPYPADVYEQVGPGGWRGKVGLLGIPESDKNVCFAEELEPIAQQQADQHTLDSARNYFTRRVYNTVDSNEGINTPYNCHDMIIINGQSTIVRVHDECIEQAASITGLGLASKKIQRNLSGTTPNDVNITTDTVFCPDNPAADHTITGTISNATGTPTVSMTDGVINGVCTSTATTYRCTITTAATSVAFIATDDKGSADCFIAPPSSLGCELVFTPPATGQHTITVDVVETGTGTISNLVITGTDATCIGTECTVADTFNGTLTATADCGGTPTTVTADSATIPVSEVTTTITLPACTSTAVNYTISGTISIDNGVDDLASISVNINSGVCTGNLSTLPGTSGTYSCTVPERTSAFLEITISPVCTDTGANSLQTTISSGAVSSTGTGVLTIDLGTIRADVPGVDGSITASIEPCNQ